MKRALCILALFLASGSLAACGSNARDVAVAEAPPARASGGDWTMYQYAPHHNAVFGRAGFRRDWVFDAKAKINGGLAVVGDVVVLDTFGKEVIALDARTGKPIWRTQLHNIVMSTPVVVNGLVYVGSGGNDMLTHPANMMQRLQYHGKAVWGVPGGDEVVALNLNDGTPRWRFRTVGEDMPSPVYDRGRIVFANGDWHAYALRADNGEQLWQRDVGGVSTMASATLANGNVLVATCTDGIRNSSMLALKPETGDVVWQSPYGHCDAAPTVAGGKIFTADVEPGSMKYVGRTVVAAVDSKTGKPVWTYRAGAQGMWTTLGSDEAAIAGTFDKGTYYQAAPLDDQLIAFDAATGKVRWSLRTAGPVKMSPVIKNGRVYVGDTVGMFYVIDSSSGKLLKIQPFKKPFTTSPPVIVGDTLFVVNGEAVQAVPLPID
jgi:outer membrane protein assembly factor BamB